MVESPCPVSSPDPELSDWQEANRIEIEKATSSGLVDVLICIAFLMIRGG